MSTGKRWYDGDDEIEQYRARGYDKAETAKRLMVPIGMVENVWARMDAAASDEHGSDREYRKRGGKA